MSARLTLVLSVCALLAIAVVTSATAAPIARTTSLISQPTGLADPNTANVAFGGASADGTRVFFTTSQKLTADDIDSNRIDVYERSGGTTTLVSATTGVFDSNTANVTFEGASDDGTRVFFTTTQRMTTDDVDADRIDIYERSAGTTKLISAATGVADPDSSGVTFEGASANGTRVFFETNQKLTVGEDDANRQDVYERLSGTGTLHLSDPSGIVDPDTAGVDFQGASDDGGKVFMTTTQKLVPADGDANRTDVYRSSGGTTSLISAPDGVADPDTANAGWGGVSPNGDHAFFFTTQKMTTDDGDTNRGDVYRRSFGSTDLMSLPAGVADPDSGDASFSATSGDGNRVVFSTTQKMTANDDDANRLDIYERNSVTTELVSAPTGVADPDAGGASFKYASIFNTRILFDTDEKLTTNDDDPGVGDIYERSGGTTTLISAPTGIADPNNAPVSFAGASLDGTRVFLSTGQQLTGDDTDGGDADIYERHEGVTTLISKPTGVADPNNAGANFGDATLNGEAVFYDTTQAFTSQDGDTNRTDVYMAADTTAPDTTITGGPSGTTGDSTPSFTFSSNDAGATFQCKVDAGAFAACASSTTVAALANGAHTFQVRGVDNVGNADASPAARAFTVNSTQPGGPGGAGGDTTAPNGRLSGKKTQKLGKSVAVTVTCLDEACRAAGAANVSVPTKLSKRFKLGGARKSIARGRKSTLKLKLSKKLRRAAKRALAKRRKLRVKISVRITDAAGNARVLRRTVRLKR